MIYSNTIVLYYNISFKYLSMPTMNIMTNIYVIVTIKGSDY